MTKKYSNSHPTSSSISLPHGSLPTDAPIAIYYRQSTDGQVGNLSTAIQTVDMLGYLKKLGWAQENIYLIDMDAGVSGTKRIDERPGMRQLFELITEGKIRAVACQDEDRLFRDVTQIQVNIFIEACRSANVLVITPTIIYDFANEHTGQFHARQFRFKSEMAAEYLTSFVIGRLHRSRMRLATEGRWFGSSIPPGFMIDTRKILPDGSRNANWRKYVPLEPYVDIVNAYFRVFLETGGCITSTVRRIRDEGIYYPDPFTCNIPDGFKIRYGFRRRKDGNYYPYASTLRYMFTNAAYLGHWCLNDTVLIWNNHPAIVPPDIFYTAFNYLSQESLDGTPNKHYRPYFQFVRPSKDDERPAERPLLAGMMITEHKGEWYSVGTEYVKREGHYRYIFYSHEVLEEYVWSKNAEWVDEAVVNSLREKLTATFNSPVWDESIDEFESVYLKERRLKVAQLSAAEQVKSNLIASLETLSDPEMIKGAEIRYQAATAECKRLASELAASDKAAQHMDILIKLKETYQTASEDWDEMSRDEKRVLIQSFIEKVEATPFDKHSLCLLIYWRDNQQQKISIRRLPTHGDAWTQEEHELLEKLMDKKASQLEISAAFANRTWRVIRDRITRTRGQKAAVFTPKPVRDFETYEDFRNRVKENPNAVLKARHTWRKEQLQMLEELLDSGASKMQLAEAFPHRLWTHIRAKVSQLRGRDFEIPGNKPMQYKESYAMYQQRLTNENEPAISNISESNVQNDDRSEQDDPTLHHDI